MHAVFMIITIQYYNKQPMGFDSQLAWTQIGEGRNFWWECSGKCPKGDVRGVISWFSCRITRLYVYRSFCATLVNTHTHTHIDRQLLTGFTISLANRAKTVPGFDRLTVKTVSFYGPPCIYGADNDWPLNRPLLCYCLEQSLVINLWTITYIDRLAFMASR